MGTLERITPVSVSQQLLGQAWEQLLGLLSAYGKSTVLAAGTHGARLPGLTTGLPEALGSSLRQVLCLQAFAAASEQLSDRQLEVLPRLCRQFVITLDADLRLQLLTCCFRYYYQQCPVLLPGLRLLQEQAQAENQALLYLPAAGSMLACGEGTRALRTLAGLLSRQGAQDSDLNQALVQGLQLITSREALASNTLHYCLMQLWKGIRHSRWQPECLRDQGVLSTCRHIQGLACIGELEDLRLPLLQLEQQVMRLHLVQCPPDQHTLERLLAEILSIQQYLRGAIPGLKRSTEPGLNNSDTHSYQHIVQPCSKALDTEIARLQGGLAGNGFAVIPGLLAQAYALNAAVLLLPYSPWRDLYRCLFLLLAQHWYQQLPVAANGARLIRTLLEQAMVPPQSATGNPSLDLTGRVTAAQRKLLHCWPAASVNPDLNITLASSAGTAQGEVPVNAMPVVLARGLDALAGIRKADFAEPGSFRQQQSKLQAALMLLEQGAAAVRVKAVELLSRALLDVYLALDWLPARRFPGGLLWRAHQQLLGLLDNAAAWGEPAAEPSVIKELKQCQQTSEPDALQGLAEPHASDWRQLRQQLQGYVQALSAVLDIQVRLHVSGQADVCTPEQLLSLHQGLIPVLRFQLLDFSLAIEERRARHQPQAGNIWLQLSMDETMARVVLSDDSGRAAPDVLQWQQLLYRLKRAGLKDAVCTCTELGRRFECVIPPAGTTA